MVNIKTKNWKIKNIDLVIFDKDGTFIDIHKYWGKVVELRAEAITKYFSLPDEFFEQLCQVMGYDRKTKKLPPDSPVGLYARDTVAEIVLYFLTSHKINCYLEDIVRIFKDVATDFLEEQEEYTVIIEDAVNLMKEFRKNGVKIVVITSDTRENAKTTIKKNGLGKYIEAVYGAEDSKTPKTSGEIVEKVLKTSNISSDKVICIGDTYDDFQMAKNSKIKACVNVATGVVTLSQHKEYNKLSVKSLGEIALFD